jgi:hypothetical protein
VDGAAQGGVENKAERMVGELNRPLGQSRKASAVVISMKASAPWWRRSWQRSERGARRKLLQLKQFRRTMLPTN